jgi:acylphosphatase
LAVYYRKLVGASGSELGGSCGVWLVGLDSLPFSQRQMKHLDIRIWGTVQGVLFRDSARRKAHDLGITGFIQNELDGSIYIEAEGEEESLNEFAAWCSDGPPLAKVETADQTEGKVIGYEDFEVR